MTSAKSLPERFAHALGYEALALLLCVPAAAWLMRRPMLDIGAFTAAVALIALLWNMLFNALFEYLERRHGMTRTFRVRLVHATAFEIGLILVVVPLAARWLELGWRQAFVLDIGLIAFYFPYTIAYNWLYDSARAAWLARGRVEPRPPAVRTARCAAEGGRTVRSHRYRCRETFQSAMTRVSRANSQKSKFQIKSAG